MVADKEAEMPDCVQSVDYNHNRHTFEYYDQINKMPLGGKSRIITLELSKLESVVEKATEKKR